MRFFVDVVLVFGDGCGLSGKGNGCWEMGACVGIGICIVVPADVGIESGLAAGLQHR